LCYNYESKFSTGQIIFIRGIIYYIQKMPKKITLENLAGMIKKGFDGVDRKFDENTKQHQQIFDRLDNLEQGQEEIKLKLDEVAYRFEVRELDRRLKKVEIKLGIK